MLECWNYLFGYFQFVDGEPVYEGCCRTNVGGFHVTDHLKQLLSLKYPYHLWVSNHLGSATTQLNVKFEEYFRFYWMLNAGLDLHGKRLKTWRWNIVTLHQIMFLKLGCFRYMCKLFFFFHQVPLLFLKLHEWSNRKEPRKLKKKPDVGSSLGFHPQLRSLLPRKRLQERQQ